MWLDESLPLGVKAAAHWDAGLPQLLCPGHCAMPLGYSSFRAGGDRWGTEEVSHLVALGRGLRTLCFSRPP